MTVWIRGLRGLSQHVHDREVFLVNVPCVVQMLTDVDFSYWHKFGLNDNDDAVVWCAQK